MRFVSLLFFLLNVCKTYIHTWYCEFCCFPFVVLFHARFLFHLSVLATFLLDTHTHNTRVSGHVLVVVRCTYSCLYHASHSHKLAEAHTHTLRYNIPHSWLLFTVAALECTSDDSAGQNISKAQPASTVTSRIKCLVVGETYLFAHTFIYINTYW